jgi:hypothetical protein
VGPLSLKDPVTLENLQELIVCIRDEMEKSREDVFEFVGYLMPKEGEEELFLRDCTERSLREEEEEEDQGLRMGGPSSVEDSSLSKNNQQDAELLMDDDQLQILVDETRDYLEW